MSTVGRIFRASIFALVTSMSACHGSQSQSQPQPPPPPHSLHPAPTSNPPPYSPTEADCAIIRKVVRHFGPKPVRELSQRMGHYTAPELRRIFDEAIRGEANSPEPTDQERAALWAAAAVVSFGYCTSSVFPISSPL
jgi:hypothetical protein